MTEPDSGDERPQRLVILDGHALIFRAYFAMPSDLRTSSGELTGAVRGFTSTLLRIIDDLEPTHIALALDVDDSTVFRREIDANYKAHRPEIPADLPPQIERCKQIAEAFSIPIFEVPGYEADDVLASLADQAADAGLETWLCTLDSDIVQLVTDRIFVYMYRPFQRDYVRYDGPAAVRNRYSIDPIQMIDYKALVGDKSDNIPGVKGVGDKTAVKLLNQYPDLEAIYDDIDAIKPAGTQKKLLAEREIAFMSKQLATIMHDAPATLDLEAAAIADFDPDEVRAAFQELEFRSLLSRIPDFSTDAEDAPRPAAPAIEVHYDLVTDEASFNYWLERALQAPLLSVDLETSSTDTIDCEIAGYALSDAEGSACYIPVGHRGDAPQLDAEFVKDGLRPILENAAVPKLLHNAKFDLKVLKRHGVNLGGLQHDTMLAAFILNKSPIGLKALAQNELGVEMTPIEDLIGKGRKQLSMVDVPSAAVGPYAAADADMTLRLANLLLPQLSETPGLEQLYRELELPLIPILAEMELAGITLDVSVLERLNQELNGEIETVTGTIFGEVGHEFNLGSPEQLSHVLFDQLGLPKTRKVKSGKYFQTTADQLERMAEAHPIVNHVLQWRELTKLRSTYVESLPDEIHASTGRIHTDFNQTVAETGRLSSEHPNLQNIPVRTEQGRQVRAAFVARPSGDMASGNMASGNMAPDTDVTFVAADYSQIELRVLAHLSRDEGLITAFHNGEDIHSATASGAYGVSIDDVQPEMRRVAKMMNFGVIYGLSAHGLSQRSGMPRKDAEAFIDAYFGRFQRVAEWIEEAKLATKEHGYAETLLGRRRYLPDIHSRLFQQRSSAERKAVNMPVQGTAADVIKRAMLEVDTALRDQELRARLLLQVHDELIFELPSEEVGALAELLRQIMPAALDLIVPMQIEVKQAANWRDLQSIA